MKVIKKLIIGILYFFLNLIEPLVKAFVAIVFVLSKIFGFIYLFGMIIYMYESGINLECLIIAFIGALILFISRNIGWVMIWYEELLFKLECWLA